MIQNDGTPKLYTQRIIEPVTYLNHDHRESENIRSPAICSLVQDLWSSPPRGVTMLTGRAACGFQVLSDRSEAKIRETRMTGVIHKDVWLGVCQCGGKTRLRTTTYSLEVPVSYIARVEVAKAFSDVA